MHRRSPSWCLPCLVAHLRPLLTRAHPPVAQDDDLAGRIASVGSVTSGTLFACGWYIFLGALLKARMDCIVWSSTVNKHFVNCTAHNHTEIHGSIAPDALVSGASWAPGILTTFGLIGLNMISWEAVVEEGSFGESVVACARIWTMASLVFLFGGLGTAIWMACNAFSVPHYWPWDGVCCLIQNILIVIAAFLFRASRRGGDHAI